MKTLVNIVREHGKYVLLAHHQFTEVSHVGEREERSQFLIISRRDMGWLFRSDYIINEIKRVDLPAKYSVESIPGIGNRKVSNLMLAYITYMVNRKTGQKTLTYNAKR